MNSLSQFSFPISKHVTNTFKLYSEFVLKYYKDIVLKLLIEILFSKKNSYTFQ